MAKIQIKTEKVTPFGGIFPIMGAFDRFLGKIVDSTLGFRCKLAGYRYSEILRSLMCVYFCGGSCIEDVSRHLMPYLSQHPTLRTCSSDTILRSIEELTEGNITYVSDQGRPYEFNPAEKLNTLLLNALLETGQLGADEKFRGKLGELPKNLIIGLFLIFVNAYLEFFCILPNNHICFLIECSFSMKKFAVTHYFS